MRRLTLVALASLSTAVLVVGTATACPPRPLPGLEPNDIEMSLGTTNVNAAVGDGRLTVALSRCGEITALKWPGPGSFDQLTYITDNAPDARSRPHAGALDEMGAFVHFSWEGDDASGSSWLRDASWTHEQRYRSSTSGVVENVFTDPELDVQVVQTAFVLPGKDVLGLHLEVRRGPRSPVGRARLVLYTNLAPTLARLPEFPVADTGLDHQNDFAVLYDRRSRALLHFVPASGRDFSLVDPILARPPAEREALAAAVEALVDRLDEPGVYLAIGARGGDSGFHAGFDDAPLCAHQSAIAERAVDSLGFSDAVSEAARAIFVCQRTVAHADGPLAACRERGGWTYEARSAHRDVGIGPLSGSPIAACQANAALARDAAFSGDRGHATFYLTAAETRDEALRLLSEARSGSPEQQIAATDAWWSRWLAPRSCRRPTTPRSCVSPAARWSACAPPSTRRAARSSRAWRPSRPTASTGRATARSSTTRSTWRAIRSS